MYKCSCLIPHCHCTSQQCIARWSIQLGGGDGAFTRWFGAGTSARVSLRFGGVLGVQGKDGTYENTIKYIFRPGGRDDEDDMMMMMAWWPGGGFIYFLFSSRSLKKWSNLTIAYFSDGLVQPPTRWWHDAGMMVRVRFVPSGGRAVALLRGTGSGAWVRRRWKKWPAVKVSQQVEKPWKSFSDIEWMGEEHEDVSVV